MAKKILSSDGQSVFAVAVSDKTVEIKRGDQLFTITGNDYNIVGTPAKGKKATVLSVRDGKIDDTNVSYVEDDKLDEEGNVKPLEEKKPEGDKPDEKKE